MNTGFTQKKVSRFSKALAPSDREAHKPWLVTHLSYFSLWHQPELGVGIFLRNAKVKCFHDIDYLRLTMVLDRNLTSMTKY